MKNEPGTLGGADAIAEAEVSDAAEEVELPLESLLDLVLEEQAARETAPTTPPARVEGVAVCKLVALDGGAALVQPPWRADPLAARAMAPLGATDVGRDVAVLFEGGDPGRPVVMGLMYAPLSERTPGVTSDGDRLELTAEKEIVLRCGQASITLTRAGKILIRGAYLLARSSGMNRIQGGSVQIN
jgi:hypothetical protein